VSIGDNASMAGTCDDNAAEICRRPTENDLIDLLTGTSEIFSVGHRNPQGLFADAASGHMAHEHGPQAAMSSTYRAWFELWLFRW